MPPVCHLWSCGKRYRAWPVTRWSVSSATLLPAGVGVGDGCANAGRAPANAVTSSGTAVAAKLERRTARRDTRFRAPAAAGCWCGVVTGMSSPGVLFTLPSPHVRITGLRLEGQLRKAAAKRTDAEFAADDDLVLRRTIP